MKDHKGPIKGYLGGAGKASTLNPERMDLESPGFLGVGVRSGPTGTSGFKASLSMLVQGLWFQGLGD